MAFGCVGNTIKTFSGTYFNLADPQIDMIRLDDIARGLSMTCRFGGQVTRYLSVAEHSVWCSRMANLRGMGVGFELAALFHDAAEAYVGDVVKPLKIMLPGFDDIERAVDDTIRRWLGVSEMAWHSESVRRIDQAALLHELNAIHPNGDGVVWSGERDIDLRSAILLPVLFLDHATAEEMFFRLAESLIDQFNEMR